jgi:hypothetical protein
MARKRSERPLINGRDDRILCLEYVTKTITADTLQGIACVMPSIALSGLQYAVSSRLRRYVRVA